MKGPILGLKKLGWDMNSCVKEKIECVYQPHEFAHTGCRCETENVDIKNLEKDI